MRFSQEITPFTTYELSVQETLLGQVFSAEQLAVLQNEIAILAMKKVELIVDPNFPAEAAEIDGQIAIIRFLMDRSVKISSASSTESIDALVDIATDPYDEKDETFPHNALDY